MARCSHKTLFFKRKFCLGSIYENFFYQKQTFEIIIFEAKFDPNRTPFFMFHYYICPSLGRKLMYFHLYDFLIKHLIDLDLVEKTRTSSIFRKIYPKCYMYMLMKDILAILTKIFSYKQI